MRNIQVWKFIWRKKLFFLLYKFSINMLLILHYFTISLFVGSWRRKGHYKLRDCELPTVLGLAFDWIQQNFEGSRLNLNWREIKINILCNINDLLFRTNTVKTWDTNFNIGENKPAVQAAGADPSQGSSTNRLNQPFQ